MTFHCHVWIAESNPTNPTNFPITIGDFTGFTQLSTSQFYRIYHGFTMASLHFYSIFHGIFPCLSNFSSDFARMFQSSIGFCHGFPREQRLRRPGLLRQGHHAPGRDHRGTQLAEAVAGGFAQDVALEEEGEDHLAPVKEIGNINWLVVLTILKNQKKMGINLHININVRITLLRFMVNG